MLKADRKRHLLVRAESLATELARGEVSRAELRPVLNVLFLTPQGWAERLSSARELNNALPTSWVTSRSGRTLPQYGHVGRALRRVFDEGYTEEEMRFLLGWAARLVHLQSLERQANSNGPDRNHTSDRNRRPRP
jgi:hypothetical protein